MNFSISHRKWLSPCITLLLFAELDILSLLRCRLVCHQFKRLVDADIYMDMRRIVGHYLPAPNEFLDALVTHGAVVSSQAALALFLRDQSILGKDLEVSVKYGREAAFNEYVRASLPVVKVLRLDRRERICHDDDETNEGRPTRVTTTYKIMGKHKRYLRVVGCGYPTPLGAVNSLRNTVLLCFFSPILMGCAYPSLTLRRLGVHGDTTAAFGGCVSSTRLELIRNLALVTNHGFRFSWNARDFIIPPPTVQCEHGITCPYYCRPYRPCVRRVYLCGCNMRYWGDQGCLMAVLQPSSAWRDLLLCPDPEGAIFTPWEWSWEICGPRSSFSRDPLEEEMNDYNCLQGESRIHQLTLHIAPSFAGEEMLYL